MTSNRSRRSATESGGRRLGLIDDWGLQRMVARITDTDAAAALVTTGPKDDAAAQHSQAAAESEQSVRVR
jgi:hypothetical protein